MRRATRSANGFAVHRAFWLLVAALGAGLGTSASAAEPASRAAKALGATPPAVPVAISPRKGNVGQVLYLTAARAYLDRGSLDGLTEGSSVTLTRGGRSVGACRIEWLNEHTATCQGKGLRQGDRFVLDKKAQKAAAPKVLPKPPSAGELAVRLEKVDAHAAPLREFDVSKRQWQGHAGHLFEASIGHSMWLVQSSGPYSRESIELGVRGAPVFLGAKAYADLAVEYWAARPSTFRFPVRGVANIWLFQAELAYRQTGKPFAFAVGRTRPYHVPGLFVIDGAHGGWRSEDGQSEIGLFAGALPDNVAPTISIGPWTAGLYASTRFSGEGKSGNVFQPELRVGWVSRPDGTASLEGQTVMHAWLGNKLDAHADVLFSTGQNVAEGGGLDALRLDVGTFLFERFRARLGARYFSGTSLYTASGLLPTGKTLRGDGMVSVDFLSGWVAAVRAGMARNLDDLATQGWVGPELSSPPLFGGRASATAGFSEELGYVRGRSTYLQAAVHPSTRYRVLGRLSYFHQAPEADALGLAGQEWGFSLSGDTWLTQLFWLRGQVLSRFDVGAPRGSPGYFAFTGMLHVGASY